MSDIAEIYSTYAPAVYWAAYSITHDEATALDVMQSVFLRALEHKRTLACLNGPQARAWLLTTAKNAGIDVIRKQRREVLQEDSALFEGSDGGAMPEEALLGKEQRAMLRAAIDELPETYRRPVLLYYFAHMQHNEIAQYLDENPSTIRSRIKRAKARLLKTLQEGGAQDE